MIGFIIIFFIFHTWCTSHGTVCDVIIDGGRCKNIVSKSIVDNLTLRVVEYLQSYKLSWIEKKKR
ncbi:hypothetical protein AXF42_Ash003066 [Apostasia shenzhenica]|uniref:Uncharacterized protein n=1 Tax=Apostasia shenzhenica TaxID=1088818 RepID=A0A2I0A825_9ASPA|nr:hypothetical protein AXF42_Ash003066 [Apostasia shenzhenica]